MGARHQRVSLLQAAQGLREIGARADVLLRTDLRRAGLGQQRAQRTRRDHAVGDAGGALDEHPSPRVLSYFERVGRTWSVPCKGCGAPRSAHYQGEVCGGFAAVLANKEGMLPWYSDFEEVPAASSRAPLAAAANSTCPPK